LADTDIALEQCSEWGGIRTILGFVFAQFGALFLFEGEVGRMPRTVSSTVAINQIAGAQHHDAVYQADARNM